MHGRHHICLLLVLGSALLGHTTPPATPAPGWWRPAAGVTWQWQLATPDFDDIAPVAVYDLDGQETDPATIARLRQRGIRTICYVNAGTWEAWRPDAEAFPGSIIGNAWSEWEGERFLDIRRLDLLAPIVDARFDECRAKGFDAIEPDNMDSWDADTGFPLTREDGVRFARWLADRAHAHGLAIAQKNAPDLVPDLVGTFDLAITEDCVADGWCDAMRPYLDAGKPVLAAEYTDRMDTDTFARACDDPALAGYSLLLKHRDLDGWHRDCAGAA